MDRWPHLAKRLPEVVPACSECNSLAGAKIFRTIGAKRRYVKQQIRRRYAKALLTPAWTEDELAELSGMLRHHVEAGIEVKRLTRERLAWRSH